MSKYGVFSGPYFPVFSPNTGKYGPEKTPFLDTFQPIISKLFKKIMQNQINGCISVFLSSYLCGNRKGYNTQQTLLAHHEKWKKKLDDKGFGGAVLMNLSLLQSSMQMVSNMMYQHLFIVTLQIDGTEQK